MRVTKLSFSVESSTEIFSLTTAIQVNGNNVETVPYVDCMSTASKYD